MRKALSFLAALFCSGPAFAQIPTSTADVVPRRDKAAFSEGAIELRRLAICAYRLNPSYVHGMLRSAPGSRVEARMVNPIGKVMEHCMSEYRPVIRFGAPALRGALAEAAYLSAHPQAPSAYSNDTSAPLLPADWTPDKTNPDQMAELAAHEFGACVLAADPADVDALLRTEPRSAEETRSIGRLRPKLGGCLYTGQTYKLDAAALRSYLAQAAYTYDRSSPVAVAQQSAGDW